MKAWATGLLGLATIVFVVAKLFESRYPWLAIVVATAEASMVGALADWFAVTALFRHPLGIPIPHTAIIPARKDRVGHHAGPVRAAQLPQQGRDRPAPDDAPARRAAVGVADGARLGAIGGQATRTRECRRARTSCATRTSTT